MLRCTEPTSLRGFVWLRGGSWIEQNPISVRHAAVPYLIWNRNSRVRVRSHFTLSKVITMQLFFFSPPENGLQSEWEGASEVTENDFWQARLQNRIKRACTCIWKAPKQAEHHLNTEMFHGHRHSSALCCELCSVGSSLVFRVLLHAATYTSQASDAFVVHRDLLQCLLLSALLQYSLSVDDPWAALGIGPAVVWSCQSEGQHYSALKCFLCWEKPE